MAETKRYTSRSQWPEGRWIVPMIQFCDKHGRIPEIGGQWVPQEVIDKLARLEDLEEAENSDDGNRR